ncbi:MAG: CU044_2847 family protein [Streptosporangiaceae bacterium]
MASRVVPMRIGDVEVLAETIAVAGTEPTSAVDSAADKVAGAFERAKATIAAVAESAADVIGRLPASPAARPATVEVEFDLGFTANGNVVLAAASASANLRVKLVYEAAERETAGTEGEAG